MKNPVEIKRRLEALRGEMRKRNLDAWYISGTDPHNSEYLPERWQTRAFISGFTGSYGLVVVTQQEAALWTDSRYFIQAEDELSGTGIAMMKLRVPDAVSPEQWLSKKCPKGARVGVDSNTLTVQGYRNLRNILKENDIRLIETSDLFQYIWEDRPLDSPSPVLALGKEIAGISRKRKLSMLFDEIKSKGANWNLITMLDEVSWAFNLRGSDVSYNPVFIGYGLIGENEKLLFVDPKKISGEIRKELEEDGIQLMNYSDISDYLGKIQGAKVLLDPASAAYALHEKIKEHNQVIETTSVVSLKKATKNKTELDGFRIAMKQDGVALIEFLYWLENTIDKQVLTEYEVGVRLREFRSQRDGFVGESFPPIVGYREHGAIVHLSVGEDDALPLESNGILLFDSGGQYKFGTTDITRTVALGQVSDQTRTDYTLVLKGMIALSSAVFPYGTLGAHLDILARGPLWANQLNYGHGTGHGVGHYLNVHEGPMSIRQEFNAHKIEPGHVLSNEPALYREGKYGIRTENLITCVDLGESEYGRFLGFETLTLCPIDTKLIKQELLSRDEKDWLNEYHKKVNAELKPLLNPDYHAFLDRLTNPV